MPRKPFSRRLTLLLLALALTSFCSADYAMGQASPTASNNTYRGEIVVIPTRGLSTSECASYSTECVCYAPDQLKKIYASITELDKCHVDLAAKDAYIKDRLVTWGAGQPVAFWQTPAFVVSGIVVTIGVTAGVTAWVLNRAK